MTVGRRRVPVVLQLGPTECAAACLAMVLRCHGRRTRLAETSEGCGVGRDGATALALKQAAEGFGLEVKAYASAPEALGEVALPAILQWQGAHFVVLERWRGGGADIVDPAAGRRRLSAEQLAADYAGMVLTLLPTEAFDRRPPPPAFTWRSYASFLFEESGAARSLAFILAASIGLLGLGLAVPVATKIVVDRVIPDGLSDWLPLLALGVLVWAIAHAVVGYLRSAVVLVLQAKLDARIMMGFVAHLLSLPFPFFQRRTSGDLLLRLGSNAVLRELLTTQSVSAVLDGVLVVTYLGILLVWEPTFALVAVALGLAQVALLLATTRIAYNLMQRDLQAQALAQSSLVETLAGIATLKASGAEERALAHWSTLFLEQLRVSVRRGHVAAIVEAALSGLQLLAPLVLLVVGAALVLGGQLTLGSMLALAALAASFLAPLASLVATGQGLQLVGAHFERIVDVLEARPEQASGAGKSVPEAQGALELRGVSFRYDPGAPLVLEDVSLVIEPGQKVCIVGATGAGKSTLGKLLLGLYSPTAGEALFDGVALAELDLRQLRRHFGVVLQEPFLFSGTIRENIALGNPDLLLDEVMDAARLAALDREIESLPMGYDTVLAEAGAGLSGGQRQRLALARALAAKPSILLLDEATSFLDAPTEARIDSNLAALSCTRVIITHRPATLRTADHIAVLEDGRLVESGTHDELAAAAGRYASLLGGRMD